MSRMMDVRPVHRTPIRQALPKVEVKKSSRRVKLSLDLPRITATPVRIGIMLVILATAVGPAWDAVVTAAKYKLPAGSDRIVAAPATRLLPQLKFDKTAQAYVFNSGSNNVGGQSAQVGGSGYKATFPSDFSKGVTIQDNTNDLALTFTPQDSYLGAKEESGHIVYPANSTSVQTVYTIKANGVKEDVVIPHAAGDTAILKYTLDLPNTLQAKLLPGGDLGIYSADPALFGNITYGSTADQQQVQNARVSGVKDHLAFIVPAPIIKESGHSSANPTAKFSLSGNTLTVTATGLTNASYPLSIDPSFIVTSVSDFQNGNVEDNINFDATNNQINRAAVTGGTVGSWGDNSTTTNPVNFVYDGYVYYITPGGSTVRQASTDGSNFTYGSQSTINSPDLLGTPSSDKAQIEPSSIVEYNGYVYAVGGTYATVNNSPCGGLAQPTCTYTYHSYQGVQYAKILSDHTLSSWQSTSVPVQNHFYGGVVTYNGYLYAYQGYTPDASNTGTTQYAKVNADGTLGTWQTSSTLSPTVEQGSFVEYNGYVYELGGWYSTTVNTVYFAPISSSGVGTWSQTSSFKTARYELAAIAYEGYLYISGGCDLTTSPSDCSGGSTSNLLSDVQYAPIYSDGTIGSWHTSNSLNESTGRYLHGMFAYNSYVYVDAGATCSGSGGSCSSLTYLADLEYAQIQAAGALGPGSAATTMTSARWGGQEVAVGGYLHYFYGCTDTTAADIASATCASGNVTNSIIHAPINNDGTIGNWTDETPSGTGCKTAGTNVTLTCPVARFGFEGTYANGLFMMTGGDEGTGALTEFPTDTWFGYFNGGTLVSWLQYSSTSPAASALPCPVSWGHAESDGGLNLYVYGGVIHSSGTCTTGTTSTMYGLYFTSGSGTSGFSTRASMATARQQFAGASYPSQGTTYLYAIGGLNSSGTAISNIERYDTTAGTWAAVCSPCAGLSARYGAGAIAIKDKLIVGGGNGGAGPLSDIEEVGVNTDGSLSGNFSSAGNFSVNRWYSGLASSGNYIYSAGGVSATGSPDTVTSSVDYFSFNDNGTGDITTTGTGSTASWSASPASSGNQFTTARYRHATAEYFSNGTEYVYVIGGQDPSTGNLLSDTQVGTVRSSDGSISWASAGQNLPDGRFGAQAVVYGNTLYLLGGERCTGASPCAETATTSDGRVYKATLNSNGTFNGGWTADTSLNKTLAFGGAVIQYAGGQPYVYYIGGHTQSQSQVGGTGSFGGADTTCVSDMEISPLGQGALSWTTIASGSGNYSLYAAVCRNSVVAYDGYIYSLGGDNQTTTTQVGFNNATGEELIKPNPANGQPISSTSANSNLLGAARQVVAINGYFYQWGDSIFNSGFSNTFITNVNNSGGSVVMFAPINSNGSIGTWATSARDLNSTVSYYAGAFAYNGRIYNVGGCNGNPGTSTANDDCNTSGGMNYAQEAGVQSLPHVAHYSKLVDTELDVAPSKFVATGSLPSSMSADALTYQTATNSSGVLGNCQSSNLVGCTAISFAPGVPVTMSPDAGGLDRYYWLSLTLDDSQSATFPDSSQSTITDFTLYFHPNPSRRLRGGASFVGGNCRVSSDSADNSGNCSLDGSP